jgi:hypothetical protein
MKYVLIALFGVLMFSGCASTGNPEVLNDNKVDFLNLMKIEHNTYKVYNSKGVDL